MNGKCLCGEIQFEVNGGCTTIYQCHCSLCRRVTGSNSNSAVLVESNSFKWLSGTDKITSFIKESGYRSEFCAKCGSPVPNELKNKRGYWVPVGLLDKTMHLKVSAHLCVSSKAEWDEIGDDGLQY